VAVSIARVRVAWNAKNARDDGRGSTPNKLLIEEEDGS